MRRGDLSVQGIEDLRVGTAAGKSDLHGIAEGFSCGPDERHRHHRCHRYRVRLRSNSPELVRLRIHPEFNFTAVHDVFVPEGTAIVWQPIEAWGREGGTLPR